MIYLLLIAIIITIFFAVRSIVKDEIKCNRLFLSISFFLIFLLMSLRAYTVGRDVIGYKQAYELVCNNMFGDFRALGEMIQTGNIYIFSDNEFTLNTYEAGYVFFMCLCAAFKIEFQLFLSIISFITLIPFGIFIFKYSKNPLFSILIFICYNYLNFYISGLRQAISISLFLIGLIVLLDEKKKKWFRVAVYYLFSFIALLFHNGAIIVFLIPLLLFFKNPKYFFACSIIVLFLSLILKNQIVQFGSLLNLDKNLNVNKIGYWGINSFFLLFVVVCLIFLKRKKEGYDLFLPKKIYIFFANLIIASVVISIFFGTNSLARLSMYTLCPIVVMLPKTFNFLERSLSKMVSGGLLLLLIAWFSYNLLTGKTFDLHPYYFYWTLGI